MLNLIYGHSGSGKTGLIYKKMLDSTRASRRSYLIVPEQETVVCERRLLDILPPSAQLTSEVLNFSRLANLVFRHYGGLSYNYADKACKTLIMWKNLRELAPLLSEYSGGKGGVRSAEEMLSTIGELKAYCVSPVKLEKAAQKLVDNPVLKSKLMDLSLIMSAYSNNLEESYSDASDDLSRLALKLKEHDFFKGADVYIDSFTSFTRQERDIIEEILKQADSVTVALTLDSISTGQVHYESAALTALDLRKTATRLSVPFEETFLGESKKPSAMLRAVSESLWSHEVFGLESDTQNGEISIIKTADPYEEADAVANTIRSLMMEGMRCRDIAVIARDASIYKGIIDIALEKAKIPYFLSQSSDIMSKAPVKFIISALKIKIYNWRREDVIAYLKTDLLGFDRSDVDAFECYTSTWNIRGSAFTGDDFTMNPDGYSEYFSERGKALLSRVNALKNNFVPSLLKFFARLEAAENAAELCRAVYLFMEENRLSEIIKASAEEDYSAGRRKEAAESLQLYNSLIRSLENIAVVIGDDEISIREFYDSIKIMLDNTAVGSIPTAKDQVTVGSASMLRTDNVKCAIIMGLCEGEFPQSVKDTGIFSDNDKKILEGLDISLSANSSVRSSDELFYVYRAMSAPSEKLILLYHTADASGEKSFPSMAVERIKKLFPSIREEDHSSLPPERTLLSAQSAFERLRSLPSSPYTSAVKDYFAAHPDYRPISEFGDLPSTNLRCELKEETSEGVFGKTLGLTQTIIDNYTDCPFEYMCKRLLSLGDGAKAEFDYSNFGTYIHYIFESYMKTALSDGAIGKEPDRRYIESTVERAARDYLQKISIGDVTDDPHLRHRFERMKRLAVLVATNVTREFADSGFRPEFFELSMGRPGKELSLAPLIIPINDEARISLSGKIDRVDTLRRGDDIYLRVVDYKSGAKTFSFGDLEKGKNVQLPLYLFALCDEEQKAFRSALGCPENGRIIPAGAMYLSSLVKPIEIFENISPENVRDMAEASISRSGFLLDDENILLEMSRSFSKQFLCGITKNKDGAISGKASVSEAEMRALGDGMKSTVIRIGNDILCGKMSPSPTSNGSELHCKNCSMRHVCRAAAKFTD